MADRGTSHTATHANENQNTSGEEKVMSNSVFSNIAEAIHPEKNSDKHVKKQPEEAPSSPSKMGWRHHHHHTHKKETHGLCDDIDEDTPNEEVKGPSVFQRMKEEVEAVVEAIHPKKDSSPLKGSPHHQHKGETHGRSDDIDELTSAEDVKGPNVFVRMKEEVEAVVEAIHPKKDSTDEQHK